VSDKLKHIEEVRKNISKLNFSNDITFLDKPINHEWEKIGDLEILAAYEKFNKVVAEILNSRNTLLKIHKENVLEPQLISPEEANKELLDPNFNDLSFLGQDAIEFKYIDFVDLSKYVINYVLNNSIRKKFVLYLFLNTHNSNYNKYKESMNYECIKLGFYKEKDKQIPTIYYRLDLSNYVYK
jgi:hypothetical protein